MAAIDSELHANRTPRFVCEGRLVAREKGGFSTEWRKELQRKLVCRTCPLKIAAKMTVADFSDSDLRRVDRRNGHPINSLECCHRGW